MHTIKVLPSKIVKCDNITRTAADPVKKFSMNLPLEKIESCGCVPNAEDENLCKEYGDYEQNPYFHIAEAPIVRVKSPVNSDRSKHSAQMKFIRKSVDLKNSSNQILANIFQ